MYMYRTYTVTAIHCVLRHVVASRTCMYMKMTNYDSVFKIKGIRIIRLFFFLFRISRFDRQIAT